ncbi:hypothetical protein Misp04_39200 [Micromonospora sp. NBRC 101691]|nr:hypothetical protein Misp04_39200 [Micromonospora sp. NBRC 101691]
MAAVATLVPRRPPGDAFSWVPFVRDGCSCRHQGPGDAGYAVTDNSTISASPVVQPGTATAMYRADNGPLKML